MVRDNDIYWSIHAIIFELEYNGSKYPSGKVERIKSLCNKILSNTGEYKVYEVIRSINEEIRFIK